MKGCQPDTKLLFIMYSHHFEYDDAWLDFFFFFLVIVIIEIELYIIIYIIN